MKQPIIIPILMLAGSLYAGAQQPILPTPAVADDGPEILLR